ncbi:GNAT family N-acetyltransferase [Scatolibacter rhodanostii]|uniref:GNAT family N-acetyltransferase n=1 Tax=Scatolibacter rhodanostii TaxID=2014781 RepID=UPI000C0817EC|nr:GNAT family N-acetyltransferase [Scatolibacter rhodanostii]
MNITNDSAKYFDDVFNMAYEKYSVELTHHTFLPRKSKSDFYNFFKPNFEAAKCIVATEDDICKGFILYSIKNINDELRCDIPVWGYGSNKDKSEKIINYLFIYLAEQIVTGIKIDFSVHLYAHDYETQKLFSYMQFGVICEKAVRCIKKIEHNSTVTVRKILKDELMIRWNDIWELLKQLLDHLKKSPVFYPCNEFTESVYMDFLTDDNTLVYIAEDKNKIIGIIEANQDNLGLIFAESTSVNVGEAFVIPEYRGLLIAQALLSCLENDLLARYIQYDWVEHGTANPNARGFWNKYFETIEYEFIRSIDCQSSTL